jgi:autotransporter-associated beta strand protein
MKKIHFLLFAFCIAIVFYANAQRKYQSLDRGVVAVNNGTAPTSNVFISWRLLAQDSDSIRFNLYCNPGGIGTYTLMNSDGPMRNTNFSTTLSTVPNNSLLCVAPVVNGVEGSKSLPFTFKHQAYRSIFLDMNFDGFLPNSDYATKFIWPADLDGDGEYDFVVDRKSTTGSTHKVEGYLRTGERLWTIDMGPNVMISEGHNDMVLAYDMNCNGKAEVVIKSSDGTRFWDKATNSWGKYLLNAPTGDTDNDGIIDYRTQSVRVPPQYITVVDGMTGAEMSTIEMPYPNDANNQYTRNSKANYMDDDYANLNGHMGIAYLDGIHPSVVMEYMCRYRKVSGDPRSEFHFYYVSAWGYKFENGKATNWEQKYTWNRNFQNAAEFHHLRIGDVDLDGKDEMLEGGYTIDDDGKLLFSAKISHGDRFRVGDINPSRPGLETFAIQQNAPDMLGQILYCSRTGEPIKKWYLAGVGDVGRGDCIDIDKNHKGYEMWSTMGNIYNAEGDIIYKGPVDMPKEGMWWDGELDREILDAKDGNGFNAMIVKYAGNGSYQNNRLIQFAQMMNWAVNAEYGCRPAFFGDIAGDWREEVLLKKTNNTGFYGFTTDYPTDVRLYCLSENPMYRMQTTTKGYYQSAYPDYYLGYDMPMPSLPPMMKTDLVWKNGNQWDSSTSSFTGYDESENLPFIAGKSVLLDISGNNADTIKLVGNIEPGILYVMTPIGHNYILGGSGKLDGSMELWKSQNGKLSLNGNHTYTGNTIISEGTLEVNGSLQSKVFIKAKGTLAGNGILNGGVESEEGLNYEGGRFSPGTAVAPFGKLTVNSNLVLNGGIYLEMNLQTLDATTKDTLIRCDSLVVNGNLNLSGTIIVNIIASEEKPLAGRYPLIYWTGDLTGDISNLTVDGLKGMATLLEMEGKTIYLVIKGQRAAQPHVHWNGKFSGSWDFITENFDISGQKVSFVNGDQVYFDDETSNRTVDLKDFLETGGVNINISGGDYSFIGTSGGLSGSGGINKTGTSTLKLFATKSTYTGPTVVNEGILEVTELADGGFPSSIGAATIDASNLVINGATLKINNANAATNRGATVQDTATIEVSQTSSYATIKGIITGSGTVVKSGPGQLSMTYDGANTYTGGTIVKAGTLAMGTWRSSFGKLGNKLELLGTSTVAIFNNDNTSAVPVFNYVVVVPEGSSVKLNAGKRCKINGTLTGKGILTLNVPYVRADLIGNWSGFEGSLNVTGNQFRLCNSNGLEKASLNLGDNLNMGHYVEGRADALTGTSKIGSLSGSATSNISNGTYQVGYNNKNATFAGVFNAGVTVSKYGIGTWILTNANLHSAPFNINAGTLTVANTTGSATGSGQVTVKSGATLDGTGAVAGAVVAETGATIAGSITIGGNATLKTGASLTVGSANFTSARKITVKKNATFEAGSITELKLFSGISANCDQLVVEQTLTPGGQLKITKIASTSLSIPATYQLFTVGTMAQATFESLVLPELPSDMEWNTTLLYTEGKLVLQKIIGISKIGRSGNLFFSAATVNNLIVIQAGEFKGKATVSVFDAKGEAIYNKQIAANGAETEVIRTAVHRSGLYLVRFDGEEDKATRKVLVAY